jgi:hypothetical protein
MDIPEIYDYLVRAHRDLWATLKRLPDEVLSRPLLNGDRFHSIKGVVFHVPAVEDGWLHEDIRCDNNRRGNHPCPGGRRAPTGGRCTQVSPSKRFWITGGRSNGARSRTWRR